MIVRLAEQLGVPLRERNTLLLAGGYAPAYPRHGLDAPELANVRAALRQVLTGHAPYPAVVIDRWWDMVDANSGVALLTSGCAPDLLTPPVNVLRLSLHPEGMAPRIVNLAQWRSHLLTQLRHRARALADQRLADLHAELAGYPGGAVARRGRRPDTRPATGWSSRCAIASASMSWRCSASRRRSARRPT